MSISVESAGLFHLSEHPIMEAACIRIPQSLEWTFSRDKPIINMSNQKREMLYVVGLSAVKVEFYDETVCVLSSIHQERSGWVQYVDDISEPSAKVLQHLYDEEHGLDVEKISVHVNLLTLTVPPMFYPQPMTLNSSLSLGMYTGPILWKGLQVIVQKQGDCYHTMTGLIIDVLLKQNTASGLEHVINMGTFDYEDVIEMSLGLPLLAYLPLQYSQHAFQPP
ncbi:hypothetical protein IW262DRAFT_1456197 [Armillaria fumosa]|nr:hypothetical protein IW262DRAFT_1456197 [Armillaria fumosa]